MLSVPSQPGENLGKVCKNSRAGENPQLRDRKSVVQGKSVDLGGRRIIKKKKTREKKKKKKKTQDGNLKQYHT